MSTAAPNLEEFVRASLATLEGLAAPCARDVRRREEERPAGDADGAAAGERSRRFAAAYGALARFVAAHRELSAEEEALGDAAPRVRKAFRDGGALLRDLAANGLLEAEDALTRRLLDLARDVLAGRDLLAASDADVPGERCPDRPSDRGAGAVARLRALLERPRDAAAVRQAAARLVSLHAADGVLSTAWARESLGEPPSRDVRLAALSVGRRAASGLSGAAWDVAREAAEELVASRLLVVDPIGYALWTPVVAPERTGALFRTVRAFPPRDDGARAPAPTDGASPAARLERYERPWRRFVRRVPVVEVDEHGAPCVRFSGRHTPVEARLAAAGIEREGPAARDDPTWPDGVVLHDAAGVCVRIVEVYPDEECVRTGRDSWLALSVRLGPEATLTEDAIAATELRAEDDQPLAGEILNDALPSLRVWLFCDVPAGVYHVAAPELVPLRFTLRRPA